MARFQLTFIIDPNALDSAEAKGLELSVTDIEPYTENTDLVQVTVRADSLHTFVELMDEDPELEDWSDIILDATIVND